MTLKTIRQMARNGEAFSCLTCYDATTARWLERAGVHLLLVGDSAAEVILGFPSTLHMPMDVAVALTAAVKRGAPSTMVMADMPFMSYQTDDADALRNAGRFMTEGQADVVKLEVDASFAPLVSKLTRAGIPICAHIGYKPQSVNITGGPVAAGRTEGEAERVVRDAVALQNAGAVLLLIEAVPPEVAERVVAETSVPVIGIGAGPAVHGQIVVLQDLLGMSERQPPFAPALADVGMQVQKAAAQWVDRVSSRTVTPHAYTMRTSQSPPVKTQ